MSARSLPSGGSEMSVTLRPKSASSWTWNGTGVDRRLRERLECERRPRDADEDRAEEPRPARHASHDGHRSSGPGSARCSSGRIRQAGGAEREVALLRHARGHPRRPQVRLAGGVGSPASSSRCARTASSRWVCAIRSSSSRVPSSAEPGPRPVHHRDRDRAVERDDRPGRDLLEHLVQREDLRPVGLLGARRLVVHRGDRRLQLVRTDRPGAERAGDERDALLDLRRVPQRRGPARRAARWSRRRPSGRRGGRRSAA